MKNRKKKFYPVVAAVLFLAFSTAAYAGASITNTWFSGSWHYWSGNNSKLHLQTQSVVNGLCRTEIWGKKNGNLTKIRARWNNHNNYCPIVMDEISLAVYSQQWDNMEVRFIRYSDGYRVGTATFKVVFN